MLYSLIMWEVILYTTENSNSPVGDFISSLTEKGRGKSIKRN